MLATRFRELQPSGSAAYPNGELRGLSSRLMKGPFNSEGRNPFLGPDNRLRYTQWSMKDKKEELWFVPI